VCPREHQNDPLYDCSDCRSSVAPVVVVRTVVKLEARALKPMPFAEPTGRLELPTGGLRNRCSTN